MSKKHNITAVILAGGKSKRMGFNKELIELDGKRLIKTQINTLHQIFNEVIVISPNNETYKNAVVRQDILESRGPLSGLHSGLSHSKNKYIYLLACDMPNIDTTFIENQISKLENQDAYIVKNSDYVEPFHGFYHKRLVSNIEEFVIKNNKFQDFISTLDINITTAPKDLFFNLNTQMDIYHYEHKNDTYKDFEIEKVNDEQTRHITDYVIDEYPLTLFINNEKYITLLATPKHVTELIVGYMRSEKLIDSYEDIQDITVSIDENKVNVILHKEIDLNSNKDKLLISGCGVGTRYHEQLDKVIFDTIESTYQITYDDVLEASTSLNNKSGLFKLTGGVHSALFKYKNKDIYFEDIGRHNAIDKIVGYITKHNIDTTQSYVFASGRISSDMLLKCAVCSIPIVISRSAPTSLAVNLAKKYGITLIGFARGNKFNIYSHSFRIKR